MNRLLVIVLMLFQFTSQANPTHGGKAEAKLSIADSTGFNEDKLASLDGTVSVDWYSKQCEFRFSNLKINCKLDVSQDLKSSSGELLMKALPQLIVSADQLSALYKGLIRNVKKNENQYYNVIDESSHALNNGLTVPFYTCGDCSKNGKSLILYNVFQSYVSRTHQITHAYMGSKKIVLKLTVSDMKAFPGSFRVIGNNSQGNFSN